MKVEKRSLRSQPDRRDEAGNPSDDSDFTTLEVEPLSQFREWYRQWCATGPVGQEAAVLATVGADGRPSARYVDLAQVDHGFVFFTGMGSAKAVQLAANPHAELCFGWLPLSRQVRVAGAIERLDPLACDEFYARLPRFVQVLAWATDQAEVLDRAAVIRERVSAVEDRFAGQEVPRPLSWGGLRLVPDTMEFWQQRSGAVPDRLRFRRRGGGWTGERVAP